MFKKYKIVLELAGYVKSKMYLDYLTRWSTENLLKLLNYYKQRKRNAE